jgi:small subunit ribosomal protein S1
MSVEIENNLEGMTKFEALLGQSGDIKRGVLMSAVVVGIDDHYVFVDARLKSNGRVPKQEFNISGAENELPKIGDHITVFLESIEDSQGNIVVSYSKAVRQSSWGKLEELFNKRESVKGVVARKVHGGCIVNIQGVSAFLPKSCFPADVSDAKPMIGKEFSCKIIKMDSQRSNIVVSLRSDSADAELINNLSEQQVVDAVVKNITDTAAFVEIGESGISARLHISEISWDKTESVAGALKQGDKIQVKIISITQGNRVNVSIKELTQNPWMKQVQSSNLEEGKTVKAKIKKIDGKLAILEVAGQFEGKLKATDVAWIKRYQNFNELRPGSEISVKIIELNPKRRVLNCSIKATEDNPVEEFSKNYKIGDTVDAEIVQISELGYVAQIEYKLDGIVPNSANYLSGSLKVGDSGKFYVHSISIPNNHVILGNKVPS